MAASRRTSHITPLYSADLAKCEEMDHRIRMDFQNLTGWSEAHDNKLSHINAEHAAGIEKVTQYESDQDMEVQLLQLRCELDEGKIADLRRKVAEVRSENGSEASVYEKRITDFVSSVTVKCKQLVDSNTGRLDTFANKMRDLRLKKQTHPHQQPHPAAAVTQRPDTGKQQEIPVATDLLGCVMQI